MLWFEREVVASLVDPSLGADGRAAVEGYVARSLRAMPEHLRLGVAAESLVLGAWPSVQHALGRYDRGSLHGRLERWKISRLDPVRQYVRLLQSLVLFAENELVPEPSS